MAQLVRHGFRAMGTACEIAVTAPAEDGGAAWRAISAGLVEVERCERVMTRFDPQSDLSRLNDAAGAWVDVDSRLVGALQAALRARHATSGRFDPTVLPALVAAGYDRTFDELEPRAASTLEGWRSGGSVGVDQRSGRARVDAGVTVDLGAIGKGYSASRAVDAIRNAWPALPGAFVDLGGDLALYGVAPDGLWRVAVADPRAPGRSITTLELEGGGVATSGRDRRRFGPNRSLHHLIDPETGTSATAGPLAVTVVAPSAAEAEAHSTALAISDLDDAREHVARNPHLAALYVPASGAPSVLGELPIARRFRFVVAA